MSKEVVSKPGDMLDRVKALQARMAKDVKEASVMIASDKPMDVPMLSTGSISLDYALGGGWAMGRIHEIYGPESVGKCLVADTYVATAEGLLTITELFKACGFNAICTAKVEPATYPLINRYGEVENLGALTWNYSRPVRQVTLTDGASIKSTFNHPHLVLDDGFLIWKQTGRLEVGDVLAQPQTVPAFGSAVCPEDRAYLLGVLIADAHFADNRISVTNDDPHVLACLRQHGPDFIGVAPKEYAKGGSIDLHFNSKEKVPAFYATWGLAPGVAKHKNFSRIMRTFDRDSQRFLIQGFMDCESNYNPGKPGSIEVSSASHLLLRQLKMMLQSFGISSAVRPKHVKAYPDTPYWRLHITGSEVVKYGEVIGSHKLLIPSQPLTDQNGIPGVARLVKALMAAHETDRALNKLAGDLMIGKTESAQAVRKLLDSHAWSDHPAKAALEALLGYNFVRIESLTDLPAEPTFDVVMPETHSFIAEGCVTHNSTLGIHAIVEAQRRGGIVAFVDAEHALDIGYAQDLGCNTDLLLISQPDHGEQALELVDSACDGMKNGDLIIIDSVASLIPKAEIDGDIADQHIGLQARMMSQALRRLAMKASQGGATILFTNQIRELIGAMAFGPKTTTPGGKALKFYASQRVEMRHLGQIKVATKNGSGAVNIMTEEKDTERVGNKIKITVAKNKIAPPFRQAEVSIIFGKGIRVLDEILDYAEEFKLVERSGAWYIRNGERIANGREATMVALADNPDMTSDLEAEVREKLFPKTLEFNSKSCG